jgi:RHS repeat-associated protein
VEGNWHPWRLAEAKSKRGLVTRYFYDASGKLEKMVREEAELSVHGGKTYSTTFEYEPNLNSRVVKTSFKADNATEHTVHFFYENNAIKPTIIENRLNGHLIFQTKVDYGKEPHNLRKLFSEKVVSSENRTLTHIDYEYDTKGRKIAAHHQIDSSGNRYTVTYSYIPTPGGGYSIETKFPAGDSITAQYDSMGRLLSQKHLEASGVVLTEQTNEYYPDGTVKKAQECQGIDCEQSQVQVFNSLGHLIETTESAAVFEEGHLRKQNYTTSFEYDSLGNLISVQDPEGSQVQYSYDTIGRPTSITQGNRRTFLEYQPEGLLSKKISPTGLVTQYDYTPQGLLISEIFPGNKTRSYEYDELGNRIKISGYGMEATSRVKPSFGGMDFSENGLNLEVFNDALGQIVSEQTPEGTWHYEYNELGDLIQAKSPAEETVTYVYDYTKGTCEAQLMPSRMKILYQLDGLERPTQVQVFDAKGSLLEVQTVSYAKGAGAVSLTKNAEGSSLKEIIDYHGRLIFSEFKDASGKVLESEKFSYDSKDHLTRYTDTQGKATRYVYDEYDQLVEEILPDRTRIHHEYDLEGRLIATHLPESLSLHFEYSGNDLIGQHLTVGGDSGTKESYKWDKEGRLIQRTDKRGIGFAYEYNNLSQLRFVRTSTNEAMEYQYDNLGHVKEIIKTGKFGKVRVSRAYNHLGHVIKEDTHLNETAHQSTWQSWQGNKRLSFQYQGAQKHFKTEYRYDEQDRLISISCPSLSYNLNYTYDSQGAMVSWADNYVSQTLERSAAGLPKQALLLQEGKALLTEKQMWEHSQQIKGYEVKRLGEPFAKHFVYGYDERGRLAHLEQISSDSKEQTAEIHYAYGVLDTLTHRTHCLDKTCMNYASKQQYGNKVEVDRLINELRSNTCPSSNADKTNPFDPQFFKQCALPEAGDALHEYDEAGNLIALKRSGELFSYRWDAWGNLETVICKEALSGKEKFTWQAVYDGLGRRLETRYRPAEGPEVNYGYWYDPEFEFLEVGVSRGSDSIAWKVYGLDLNGELGGLQGLGGLRLVADSQGNQLTPIEDLQGNILGYVQNNTPSKEVFWNAPLKAAENSSYADPYGPLVSTQKSLEKADPTTPLGIALLQTCGWRGKRQDPSGLFCMGTRYYDPSGGRFISPDPYGHFGSLDLYSFANGNPVLYWDADGRFASPLYERILPRDLSSRHLALQQRIVASAVRSAVSSKKASKSVKGLAPRTLENICSSASKGSTAADTPQPFMDSPQKSILSRFASLGKTSTPLSAICNVYEQVQKAATQAYQNVGSGKGPVHGTKVHSEFKRLLEALRIHNLYPEKPYLLGEFQKSNRKGSVRFDVVYGPLKNPWIIWDLKTGQARLTSSRILQMRKHLPYNSNPSINLVRP